jgi:hypothetical protein
MTDNNAALANDGALPNIAHGGRKMKEPTYIENASRKAAKLEGLLLTLALAADGEEVAGAGKFVKNGGRSVIEMAAQMAGEISESLELGERQHKAFES